MRSFVFITLLCAAMFAAAQTAAPAKPADAVHSEMLVSTQWLSQHLKDPTMVILHVADSELDYKRGHIPGARYLAFKKITTENGQVTTELPSVEELQKTFAELGVGD